MAESDPPTDKPARPSAEEHCPHCGASAERGQLVCLECGSRIALTYRRPPSWKVPLAISAVVLALFLLGAVVAVVAVGDDAKREVSAAPPRPQSANGARKEKSPPPVTKDKAPPPVTKDKAATPARREATGSKPAAATENIVPRGALYAWPRSLVGFSVVINTAEDRASTTAFAESAAKSRSAKIGVIRADDFRTLPKGFYVVFAGYYQRRAQAEEATARLGKRFSGAFTTRITR
ncbi:MAG: zinc ribbon domain-containing protein [Thermoleophilaceae bacterium]